MTISVEFIIMEGVYYMGTSKNRFEKGKWVECAECDESLLVRLYALRGGLKKQSVCYTHFHSNKVFRGDHILYIR